MQVADGCNSENVKNGLTQNGSRPCNANPQNQQHGYSTTLRDTRFDKVDPDGKDRFKLWIEDELVDAPEGVETNEKVLLLDGLGRMLAKARTSGDLSGEYSLARGGKREGSNLQKYHKEIENDKKAISDWQPLLAWSGWWVGFSRPYGERKPTDTSYFTKTDLEDFFLRGKFPDDWRKRSYGFKETFAATLAMKGMNIADDQYLKMIEDQIIPKDVPWYNPLSVLSTEKRYFLNMGQFFGSYIGSDLSAGNTHQTYTP
jgi:hypothetical protein